jgi:peptidoglycan/xylan/chitin deacetylase (PgdA/CDA1 family)
MSADRVYVTFDDGPNDTHTPRLLDVLGAHGAKGTFFVQGTNAARFPALARRIVEDGHGIGGHSWSHRRLPQWAFGEARREFERTRQVIRDVTGVDSNLYRPPYGWVTVPMLALAATGRLRLVLWSIDSDDDRTRSVEAILARGLQVTSGDIVLCHDDNSAIVDAMPALLGEWRARGLHTDTLRCDGPE